MSELAQRTRIIKITSWGDRTLGEKLVSVVVGLIKVAAIAAIATVVIGALVAVIAGAAVAFGIVSAIAGGFGDASKAYRSGDVYVKFR